MYFKKNVLAITWILIAALSRIIPHIPNATPFTALSIFAGSQLPKHISILTLLSALLLSDVALAYLYNYPVFGVWSLFTYSGFLIITLLANKLITTSSWLRIGLFTLIASCGYWLWTNLGTWFFSGIYPKTFIGLILCYEMALPFLRNSLMSDLIWTLVIFGLFRIAIIAITINRKTSTQG